MRSEQEIKAAMEALAETDPGDQGAPEVIRHYHYGARHALM